MGIEKKYRKEEFKDLAELLVWASERKEVFFGGSSDCPITPSDMIKNLTVNFRQGSYQKAIEIKEEVLGKLYVCIKQLPKVENVSTVGNLAVIDMDDDTTFWRKCTIDSKGIVKSVVSDD